MPSKSKHQRRLMGWARAYQKGITHGEVPEAVKRIARGMSGENLDHFAKTKEKGLPEKVSSYTPKILAHIAGPSGSGKTTLLNELAKKYTNIAFKDLDEFDEAAKDQLGWSKLKWKDYSDKMLVKLNNKRQTLLNNFIKKYSNKQVVLGGYHDGQKFNTSNRFYLNTKPEVSAQRALDRSIAMCKEFPEHVRKIEELPEDITEAKSYIKEIRSEGYKAKSPEKIRAWLDSVK